MIFPDKFDRGATYYLSGPMTGIPEYNRPTFAHSAFLLRGAGLSIESPHELAVPDNLVGEELWQHMMVLCKQQMQRCRGTIFLPGWVHSRGSNQEFQWGKTMEHLFYFMAGVHIIDMNGDWHGRV